MKLKQRCLESSICLLVHIKTLFNPFIQVRYNIILFLVTLFACGDGIVPLPASTGSEIDAVILCGEGITVNWSDDQNVMKAKFDEAIAELDLCE